MYPEQEEAIALSELDSGTGRTTPYRGSAARRDNRHPRRHAVCGMLAVRDGLMREIRSWSDDHRVDLGPLFMRLHVVDMAGDMDIEVGAVADVPPLPDGRIRRGELPAGRYATLTYVDHAIRANRHLFEWTDTASLTLDRRATPAGGDAFSPAVTKQF